MRACMSVNWREMMSCIENEMGTCVRFLLGYEECAWDCVLENPENVEEIDEVRRSI